MAIEVLDVYTAILDTSTQTSCRRLKDTSHVVRIKLFTRNRCIVALIHEFKKFWAGYGCYFHEENIIWKSVTKHGHSTYSDFNTKYCRFDEICRDSHLAETLTLMQRLSLGLHPPASTSPWRHCIISHAIVNTPRQYQPDPFKIDKRENFTKPSR